MHFLSAEACINPFYESPGIAVAERLASMVPRGDGLKGLVKKILSCKPLNSFLYRLIYTMGPVFFASRVFRQRILLRRYTRQLRNLCRTVKADAILYPSTGIPNAPWECVYFPKISLPVIALQSYSTLDADTWMKRCEEKHNGKDQGSNFGRRLANVLIPHWGWRTGQKIMYPAPPVRLLSLLACGVPRYASLEDARSRFAGGAISSEMERKKLEFFGTIPANWEIVGDITSDILVKAFEQRDAKRALYSRDHNFSHKRVLALDLQRSFPEESFEFLLRVAVFARNNTWDVVFCPHPGSGTERHVGICRQNGFAVSVESTAVTLPMCDLYVSFESTTCLWAAQLGIPVVSLGIWGKLGTTGWEGSAYFESWEEDTCEKYIQELLFVETKYSELRQKAEKGRFGFGILDGQCGERFVRYVEKIVSLS